MSKSEITQVSLRLTADVYEMLKAKTGETGRSLNAEVIQAIIEHCDPGGQTARLDRLERLVSELGRSTNPPPPTRQS